MERLTKKLIAPCGMNCGLCVAYLRKDNKCPGCYTNRKVNDKPIKCSRKLCKKRKGDFCYDCDTFPCDSIKRLDDRYKKRYGMSEIENLLFIKEKGIDNFIKEERKKWQKDQAILCVHDKKYYL